jgi:MFS family permease
MLMISISMVLLYAGAFLTSLSLFMLSLVRKDHYFEVGLGHKTILFQLTCGHQALICQGIGLGFGAGLLYVPSSAIVSQYFYRRRGFVMPIVSSGVPLGSVVTPILINGLLKKPNLTFAFVIRINAGFVSSILVLACWLIRPRLSPPKKHANLASCTKRFLKDGAYVTMIAGWVEDDFT